MGRGLLYSVSCHYLLQAGILLPEGIDFCCQALYGLALCLALP